MGSEINSDRLLCNESMICDQGLRCVEAVFFSKFQAGPLWRDHFVACSLALKYDVSRQSSKAFWTSGSSTSIRLGLRGPGGVTAKYF